ncbi:peptidase domain-containing ABC transporter [Corallococcus sp. CA047B]|uniref:peptidase domain-containing ABC transporter n=1 Tax=Corallococcus sp. CA047B TaxID=2316729 RepID=UPI000EA10637|nr:peptidase domain-containing ABC transporter [Corallococcus sp. CA047B]RKH13171.1 peptidase domain-containing ABC transporter [Corallococcus sp. CA047B]
MTAEWKSFRPWAERFKAVGWPRRSRRLTEVRQLSVTDCGAACLTMVLAYHGREMTLDAVRDLMGVGRDGITARTLLDTGRRLGMRGRALSLDLDGLPHLPTGAILHWDFNHYVVFEKLLGNRVLLMDPGRGRRTLTMEAFRLHFTGVVLLFEPADDFQQATAERGGTFRYLRSFVRDADSLGRIVMLSAALQLFALGLPLLTGMVVDQVVPRGDTELLGLLSLALATMVGFHLMSTLIRGHLLLELRTRLDMRMTLGFLDHLVDLAYSFFQVRPAGDLMMRMNTQVKAREILSSSAISTLLDGTMVLLYFAALFTVSGRMGLAVLGLGLAQVLVFLVTKGRRRSLLAESMELESKSQSHQISMLTGMQTLKAFGAERRAVESYSHLFVDVLNSSLAWGRLTLWVDGLSSTLRLASPLVLLSLGASLVLQGRLTLGEMLSLNALTASLLVPLSNLIVTAGQFQLLGGYLSRINDVLETPPEQPRDRVGRTLTLQGAIELEQVSFRYSLTSPWVAQNITLRISPGQMVAIVGRSGAGKTTLANLLLGLYLPTSGHILYDGADLRELDLRALRSQMGIVLQEPAFFTFSLRDNITLSAPELPMERVTEACRLAHIHDDILAMPMQYSTLMVDRGLSLSGGQRQRLALARALVHRPAVLLLDEATSALDAITESRVQDALTSLRCTRIVIAHRLSTVRRADLIVVMDEGRLVEQGRHEELLARGGVYAQLVQSQLEQKPLVARAG